MRCGQRVLCNFLRLFFLCFFAPVSKTFLLWSRVFTTDIKLNLNHNLWDVTHVNIMDGLCTTLNAPETGRNLIERTCLVPLPLPHFQSKLNKDGSQHFVEPIKYFQFCCSLFCLFQSRSWFSLLSKTSQICCYFFRHAQTFFSYIRTSPSDTNPAPWMILLWSAS